MERGDRDIVFPTTMEYKRVNVLTTLGIILVAAVTVSFLYFDQDFGNEIGAAISGSRAAVATFADNASMQPYKGVPRHIFFHSLVVYPELAYSHDGIVDSNAKTYEEYMITRDQFEKILAALYSNNYVLVDIHSIYGTNADGTVYQKEPLVPKGKKPLILSIDDLNYYYDMRGRGFADKLVLDGNGDVATEIVTPDGKTEVTRDGDIVPILDDFVKAHPDFSVNGAKGVIAETGYNGVLGYRTQASSSTDPAYMTDYRKGQVTAAEEVVARLKATGWIFASHSYSHRDAFSSGAITLDQVQTDISEWHDQVQNVVGPTDIFIGPFGQVFKPGDPRRQAYVDAGFRMLAGVGMDAYLQYFKNAVVMDRADIDDLRMTTTPDLLKQYFDAKTILGQ